jgi:hypothetical protein
MTYTR